MKAKSIVVLLAVVAGLVAWLISSPRDSVPPADRAVDETRPVARTTETEPSIRKPRRMFTVPQPVTSSSDEEAATSLTEEESREQEEAKREREEEATVDDFDSLTDKWMEPAKGGVTMKDVETFAALFRKVPMDRKDECLHRALNLVPDENIMLLAGILMDKSQDPELIELVYNDVLNRSEDVKQPILQQIFKDKEHPCWADTAWILDVTEDLSAKK